MPRGYRHFVFAFVGWLSLANAPQPSTNTEHPKAEANQAQTAPAPLPPANAVEEVEPSELYRPCDKGQEARNSDLCAQWKAADAARDAADWTYYGVLLGILGTLGLFWTLYYTRAAVKAAQEATKDADTALEIARRNADAASDLAKFSARASEIQLRAYMAVVSVEVEEPELDELGWGSEIHIKLRNNGQTPAEITGLIFNVFWHANDEMCTTLLKAEKDTSFRIHRGGEPMNMPLRMWAEGEGLDQPGQLLAAITLEYKDVFENEYGGTFCFHFGDKKLPFQRLEFPFYMSSLPERDFFEMLGAGDEEEGEEPA